MNRNELLDISLHIILNNQESCGSFPASPSFPRFRFCWPRDGIFTACGALAGGYPDSARCFLLWMHRTLLKHKPIVESLKEKLNTGCSLNESDFLPARFTMDGNIEPQNTSDTDVPFYFSKWPEIYSLNGVNCGNSWPNFQTDCYGSWLWGIAYYAKETDDTSILEECRESINLTIDYLKMTWEMPCYDPWEEYGRKRSIGTLGSIAGGLIAINEFRKDREITELIEKIRTVLRDAAKTTGFLPKYIGSSDIDGNSLWLFVPFNVFSPEDPIVQKTIRQIEDKLVFGGVKRYLKDVYYGGGEWIVLTCWLSWYYTTTGNYSRADELLQWCETHADKNGCFPEQILEHLNFPKYKEVWESNWWNESPVPLLWAHAMYIIACKALDSKITE
ncbi:hypothetical protein H8S37_09045 [Mediterraneibacter sp. NSJ-55]|uniref:GH15-like domain-containing protein n=1 Tax=Mediterraneibacter hominis TaxID=2763054 RepID=A0A923RQ33_9FIRM|nr:glycoside hydrolase family 15 protein [Mediterraneibacter hominis]MBC5689071.1 hypothetical protein [Mediterraneibacter hominis]